MDRLLNPNTSKAHARSPFRQGCKPYDLVPDTSGRRLALLMEAFGKAVPQASALNALFAQAKREDG